MLRNRIISLAAVAVILLALASCADGTSYYELSGGDPDIDYLEFRADSTCLFIAPGPVEMVCPYTEKNGVITVSVVGFVKGKLVRKDNRTLVGEAPFFEGTWVKKRPPHREAQPTDEE